MVGPFRQVVKFTHSVGFVRNQSSTSRCRLCLKQTYYYTITYSVSVSPLTAFLDTFVCARYNLASSNDSCARCFDTLLRPFVRFHTSLTPLNQECDHHRRKSVVMLMSDKPPQEAEKNRHTHWPSRAWATKIGEYT